MNYVAVALLLQTAETLKEEIGLNAAEQELCQFLADKVAIPVLEPLVGLPAAEGYVQTNLEARRYVTELRAAAVRAGASIAGLFYEEDDMSLQIPTVGDVFENLDNMQEEVFDAVEEEFEDLADIEDMPADIAVPDWDQDSGGEDPEHGAPFENPDFEGEYDPGAEEDDFDDFESGYNDEDDVVYTPASHENDPGGEADDSWETFDPTSDRTRSPGSTDTGMVPISFSPQFAAALERACVMTSIPAEHIVAIAAVATFPQELSLFATEVGQSAYLKRRFGVG